MNTTHLWWQAGVVYQIYPRSFQDSTGDGVGDLNGITERLDYLRWLGVDALWISPIFRSPMVDFGYDVADYTDVDPIFGTLADFERLLAEAHARGLKVLLDLVPNHSSDEHPWFVQSRRSRTSPYRDWYIWRDPAPDGGPPNNWLSHFGGPAWSFDPLTGQYYLHLFDPKQPDLNWRNPAVSAAITEAMRFWLRMGVDGFRVDVIWMLLKHPDFPDNPPNLGWTPDQKPQNRLLRRYDQHQPEVHALIRELRTVTDAFDERVLIGEIYLPFEELVGYYGPQLDEVHLPFNFHLVTLKDWRAPTVRALVERYEALLPPGGWPNWVLGNHDHHRIASRVGQPLARLAQVLLLTLRGTPTLYYGDEIGMEDVAIPPAQAVDPEGLRTPGFGRDPERTPMQWDSTHNAGFSTGQPWLPLAEDFALRNVAAQRDDPRSMLTLTRALLDLRRSSPALSVGDYASVEAGNEQVFAYLRTHASEQRLIVLNFGAVTVRLDLSALAKNATVLLSSTMAQRDAVDLADLTLSPYEGLVLKM